MPDNDNQNAFQARLDRLKNPDSAQSNPADEARKLELANSRRSTARRIQMWGVMFLLAVLGAAYLNNHVEGGIQGQFTRITTNLQNNFAKTYADAGEVKSGFRPIAVGRPRAEKPTIEQTDQGTIMRSPSVLAAEKNFAVTDLFADFDPGSDQAIPADVTQFQNLDQCTPRRPAKGEKVIGVRMGTAQMATQMQAFNKVQIARKLTGGMEAALRHRRKVRLGVNAQQKVTYTTLGQVQGNMKSIDVILTDTSAPLYLVLQAMHGQVIWNLHLGPDVSLKHVVMISSNTVAVSGLPDGTSYEAMKTGDFNTGSNARERDRRTDNSPPPDCMIIPWRNPQPHWGGVKKAQRGNDLFINQMETYSKGYAAYNNWYLGAIGQDAAIGTLVADSAAHVLLGPKPVEKLTYHKIDGNHLLITPADYIIKGDAQTRASQVTKLHNDLFFAALGGELDTLWPDPMEASK